MATLYDVFEATGVMPPSLAAMPRPTELEAIYLNAFSDLQSSRVVTMNGVGAIPVSEILAYSVLAGYDSPDERLTLLRMIQAMDREWLSHDPGKHAPGRG